MYCLTVYKTNAKIYTFLHYNTFLIKSIDVIARSTHAIISMYYYFKQENKLNQYIEYNMVFLFLLIISQTHHVIPSLLSMILYNLSH